MDGPGYVRFLGDIDSDDQVIRCLAAAHDMD
jgi:hypothetical protein